MTYSPSTPAVSSSKTANYSMASAADAIVVLRLAQRARISIPHATVVAQLAGLGPQAVR